MAASGVNVKMGVTGVAQFKQNINQAKQTVKTLDAQLALSEKQFKASGDAEGYMTEKSELLKAKLEAQKGVVESAENALKKMADQGIDRSSKAYQDMYRQMLQAKGEMIDTESAMNGIGEAGETAAAGVEDMNNAVQSIGKQVSFETVTNGIGKITGAMEKAAQIAMKVGKAIVQQVLGVGTWADDTNTRAKVLGVSPEELQAMEKTARIIDTDAETIIKARQRLNKGLGNGSKATSSALEFLGISEDQNPEDIFWKAGEALMNLTDETEQEAKANDLFGKSWHELIPLFDAGREEYEKMNASWTVMTKEQLDQLNEMDDEYQKLQIAVEDLKREALSNLAEPMRDALKAVNDLLGRISDWLKSDEGKAAVENVVQKVKDAAEWLVNNTDTVIGALGTIVSGWGLLKLTGGALQILQLINGINGLKGAGAAGAGAQAAARSSGVAEAGASSAGVAGTGFFAKLAGGAKSFLSSGVLETAGVVAAAITPALIANAADDKRVEEQRLSRLASASMMQPGVDRDFLERASNALGLKWHGGNEAEVESILMGMGKRSDLQKAQLQALLQGSTANGNRTWDELQRLWNGEPMDMGQQNAILQSVTDAYQRMAEQSDRMTESTQTIQEAVQEQASRENAVDADELAEKVGNAAKQGILEKPLQVRVFLQGDEIMNYIDRNMGALLAAAFGG